jgi:hypothetical protein
MMQPPEDRDNRTKGGFARDFRRFRRVPRPMRRAAGDRLVSAPVSPERVAARGGPARFALDAPGEILFKRRRDPA